MVASSPITPQDSTFQPMLDLFQQLRRVGMPLTIEEYHLLRQALAGGYDLENWEDLRDLCRLLWLKPSCQYSMEVFEEVFDRYRADYQQKFENLQRRQEVQTTPIAPTISLGILPKLPLRRFGSEDKTPKVPDEGAAGDRQVPVAVKQESGFLTPQQRKEYTIDIPISVSMVQQAWQVMRGSWMESSLLELDLPATITKIESQGSFVEVVLSPALRKRADLLMLVDDSSEMQPFWPVIKPLTDAVSQGHLRPAQIYRFKAVPTRYLYQWQRPLAGEAIEKILGRMHRQRTVVAIVSDGGAGSVYDEAERVQRIKGFLQRLQPCVRKIFWLNPFPEDCWAGTTAIAIQDALAGGMIPLEGKVLLEFARASRGNRRPKEWMS